jgi:hypothetical protein
MSALVGEWTHRRGDLLGSRFVRGAVGEWKPKVAFTWRPAHGGRVDQVRLAGDLLIVVTMPPGPPGWSHALVHLLDAKTGKERAVRRLPDPAPVGAIAVGPRAIHVAVAGDAVAPYHYALERESLRPLRRTALPLTTSGLEDDVLDLWAPSDERVAFEVELGAERARRFGWVDLPTRRGSLRAHEAGVAAGDRGGPPRDGAVCGEHLVVPVPAIEGPPVTPAGLARMGLAEVVDGGEGARGSSMPPEGVWVRSTLERPTVAGTVVGGESSVTGVFAALAGDGEGDLDVEVQTLDRGTSVVRHQSVSRLAGAPARAFSGFRSVRTPAGALFLQPAVAGAPAWGLALKVAGGGAAPDGVLLGARGTQLAFGTDDALVVVREKASGIVTLTALDANAGGGLQGRRAKALWAFDVPEVGDGVAVYAGPAGVVVRSSRGLSVVTP